MRQKAFTQLEWEKLQKQISKMSRGDGEKWLHGIYKAGFDDAKNQISPPDSDIYIWDESQVRKILRESYISDRLIDEIIVKLEK